MGRFNILPIRWRYSICKVSNMQKVKLHKVLLLCLAPVPAGFGIFPCAFRLLAATRTTLIYWVFRLITLVAHASFSHGRP